MLTSPQDLIRELAETLYQVHSNCVLQEVMGWLELAASAEEGQGGGRSPLRDLRVCMREDCARAHLKEILLVRLFHVEGPGGGDGGDGLELTYGGYGGTLAPGQPFAEFGV